jgi:hypothetical protein
MQTGKIRTDAPFSDIAVTLTQRDCEREHLRLSRLLESEKKAYLEKKKQTDEKRVQHAERESKRYKEAFEGLHGEKGVPKLLSA